MLCHEQVACKHSGHTGTKALLRRSSTDNNSLKGGEALLRIKIWFQDFSLVQGACPVPCV